MAKLTQIKVAKLFHKESVPIQILLQRPMMIRADYWYTRNVNVIARDLMTVMELTQYTLTVEEM